MMLQNVNIALSVVLCGCLLSGCNNSTTSASSSASFPSTSDYESSSAATSNLDSYEDEEPMSVVPSSTLPPTEEPNTPDSSEPSASPAQPEQEYTDLSFLSEEQQTIYLRAEDFCFTLFGNPGNLLYLDWALNFAQQRFSIWVLLKIMNCTISLSKRLKTSSTAFLPQRIQTHWGIFTHRSF